MTTTYYLNGSSIVTEMRGSDRLDYYYDEQGNLFGFKVNDAEYYYIRNGQNDIIGILDSTGSQVVSYTYDSWGKLISMDDQSSSGIGTLNPFRYRGYYYDSETDLYYLNSRYYDANTGRFLNADSQVAGVGQIQGYNMFAYGNNNPVMTSDPSGHWPNWGQLFSGAISLAVGIVAIAAVVGTGGAATPLVALGLSIVATAGVASTVTGYYTVAESLTGCNPLRKAMGSSNYDATQAVSTYVSSAGSAWVYETLNPPGGGSSSSNSTANSSVSKGSTGRTSPTSLKEQLAMEQVKSNPLEGAIHLPIHMTDPKWPGSDGWIKMSNNVNGVEIHFNYNQVIKIFDDFKFK